MNPAGFTAICLISLLRAGLSATLAGWLVGPIQRVWSHAPPSTRRRLACLLAAVVLCPPLLVGYFYNGGLLTLAQAPTWRADWLPGWEECRALLANHLALGSELWLITLIAARNLPVGVLATIWLQPDPEDSVRDHLFRLGAVRSDRSGWSRRGARLSQWVRRLIRSRGPAWGLMFLSGFQEFELATRLGRPAWTAWLIDALAGGIDWWQCLGRFLLPLGVQLAVLFVLGRLTRWPTDSAARRECRVMPPTVGDRWWAWSAVLGATWWVMLLPLGALLREAGRGFHLLWQQPVALRVLLRETAVGWLVAGLSAGAALAVAERLGGGLRHGRLTLRAVLPWLVPGLLGSLALGLVGIRVVAGLGAWGLPRSVIPWGLLTTLWLLPRAACLGWIADRRVGQRAVHAARLLTAEREGLRTQRGNRLVLDLLWWGRYGSWSVLCQMAMFELPLGQLLAPVGMAPAPVSLYTQMHYGRADVLSAMTVLVLVSSVVGTLLAGVALVLSRPWIKS